MKGQGKANKGYEIEEERKGQEMKGEKRDGIGDTGGEGIKGNMIREDI